MEGISLRPERPQDVDAIARVTEAAFRDALHGSGTEARIVHALRLAGALTVSIVAERGNEVVGHVAISPVSISAGTGDWYGLGPVSVLPVAQRRGIGSALILAALDRIAALGARGCVVLGEPAYYERFGFRREEPLQFPGAPAEYFQAIVLSPEDAVPAGIVEYHEAFGVSNP
jgi:predicted N-acetyltransferase YhbS